MTGRSPPGARLLAILLGISLLGLPAVTAVELAPVVQNDAGSGRDAPGTLSHEVPIEPDVVYSGSSSDPILDGSDVYHLHGVAGQVFRGWADGHTGCYYLLDAGGAEVGDYACSYGGTPVNTGPLETELPYTGEYYFEVTHITPALYQFGFSLTGRAPEVRTLVIADRGEEYETVPGPMPSGCTGDYVMVPGTVSEIPKFTDDCYHMRTGLNKLDTTQIDVLLLPPVTPYPERDLRVMREAVKTWDTGIQTLAPTMGLEWLSAVQFNVFVGEGPIATDPLWDPEIIVVSTNPVGGAGIGIEPMEMLFGGSGPCHGTPNPLAGFDTWAALPGFDRHHASTGTYSTECEGGGSLCFAINGAIDPAPDMLDFFGLFDLVAHEFGHCLTVGHVGDAEDHKANAVPYADIMSYTNQAHDKCVSTLDVESFALTMSRFLQPTAMGANDGVFQVQHPDAHRYASPTGLAKDCPRPDVGLIPGMETPSTSNDAGSGRDAPDGVSQDITIQPGIVYEGSAIGPLDLTDTYHFTGVEGQVFRGWSDGNLGCYYLIDDAGNDIANECAYAYTPINTGPLEVTLPYTGDFYFRVANLSPALYRFAFALDATPPDVRLESLVG